MDFVFSEMGKRIAKRRKHFGLTQGALAETLEISNNHLSCIETGRTQPSMSLFVQICNELRVTPDYLIMGATHSTSVPQAIIELLELCSEEDIRLLYHIAAYMVERNGDDWNRDNFI